MGGQASGTGGKVFVRRLVSASIRAICSASWASLPAMPSCLRRAAHT
jgi:hypothetical protein